jgi:hypothetical protein
MNEKSPEKGRRTKGAVAACLSGLLLHIECCAYYFRPIVAGIARQSPIGIKAAQ